MLTIASVAKSYGPRVLFEEVSTFIKREDRLGLVGPNGAGKSTLFNLILGEEAPDSGSITWERGADFGHLAQETAPAGDETILDLATAITPEFAAIRDKIRAFEAGAPAGNAEEDDMLHHRFEELGGYTMETKAKIVLSGLGFREIDFDRKANTFSGGWVMRAHLARLLVREPTLLLLDEPTNHLDLEALIWFQDYLTRYPGGLIVISHDRAFLNALCTGILEMRDQTLYRWTGNYDDYLLQKEAHREQQAAAFKNQQREIAHLQRFVDRFGAKASMAEVGDIATALGESEALAAMKADMLTEAQARQAMSDWLGRLWFAPNGLQEYARKGRALTGIYVPYWTFDADTLSRYQGERGEYWYETRTVTVQVNGKTEQRQEQVRHVNWYPVSGTVSRQFDDVLVMAAQSLPRRYVDGLEPWTLAELRAYSTDYLAGFRAEGYTVGPEDGHTIARARMDAVIQGDVRRDIGGDEQRISAVQTQASAETFKHILLPIWMAAYKYGGKSYRFVVNAQTGKVQGERPWSKWKIGFAVVLGLIVAGAAAYYYQKTH